MLTPPHQYAMFTYFPMLGPHFKISDIDIFFNADYELKICEISITGKKFQV